MTNPFARTLSIIALLALGLAACAPGSPAPQPASTSSPATLPAATETLPPAAPAAPAGQVELTGMIEAMTDAAWTLNGQVLAILPATELKGSFQVGDLVKAQAAPQADGSLAATQVEPLAAEQAALGSMPGAEYDFTGAVDAIAIDQWSVAGVTFAVTPETEIKGTFNIGDLVKVHVVAGTGGALTAREIEAPEAALEAAPAGSQVEFVGLVESIAADAWVVGGKTLAITPETEIKGTFKTGDAVKVHVLVGSDGTLTAREIEAAQVGQLGDDNSNANSNSNENEIGNSNTNDNTANANDNGGNSNSGGNSNGGSGNDNGGHGNDNGGG